MLRTPATRLMIAVALVGMLAACSGEGASDTATSDAAEPTDAVAAVL